VKLCILTSIPELYLWRDGLYNALGILGQEWDIDIYLDHERPTSVKKYDMVIGWGAFQSPEANYVAELPSTVKKGLFFAAGHGQEDPLIHKFDIIFAEDKHSLHRLLELGGNARLAFGINAEIFNPDREELVNQPVLFDVFHPGAYALWKRKELFAEVAKGKKALSVGILQEIEREEHFACQKAGVMTLPNVPQEFMPWYYASAKCVAITGWAGSQRTVLEALAMNKQCIIPTDAPQLLDYSKNVIVVTPTIRNFRDAIDVAPKDNPEGQADVFKNWTEVDYANSIKEGVESVC